jgi:hypothetical protein
LLVSFKGGNYTREEITHPDKTHSIRSSTYQIIRGEETNEKATVHFDRSLDGCQHDLGSLRDCTDCRPCD